MTYHTRRRGGASKRAPHHTRRPHGTQRFEQIVQHGSEDDFVKYLSRKLTLAQLVRVCDESTELSSAKMQQERAKLKERSERVHKRDLCLLIRAELRRYNQKGLWQFMKWIISWFEARNTYHHPSPLAVLRLGTTALPFYAVERKEDARGKQREEIKKRLMRALAEEAEAEAGTGAEWETEHEVPQGKGRAKGRGND